MLVLEVEGETGNRGGGAKEKRMREMKALDASARVILFLRINPRPIIGFKIRV